MWNNSVRKAKLRYENIVQTPRPSSLPISRIYPSNRRPRALTISLILTAAALYCAPHTGMAQSWHYVLGEERANQQANFCVSEADAREIAGIFERFSPRTGYSALSDARHCYTAVSTFTPDEVLLTITVAEGESNEYTISFVRVFLANGDVRYLMTTRDVEG